MNEIKNSFIFKTSNSNFSTIKMLFSTIIIAIVAAVAELIGNNYPLINVNNLSEKANLCFSALIIFALFSGTVLAFARFDNAKYKYGFSSNERILLYNNSKIIRLNLMEIIFVNYGILPLALFGVILEFPNYVITLFVVSILLTLEELRLSIKVLLDDTDDIEEKCKNRLIFELLNSDYSHVEIMFRGFLEKINDNFIFEKNGEYRFFTEKLLKLHAKDSNFAYYIEAQWLISKLMADRRMNWPRLKKVTMDLIYGCKWPVSNSIIIYIDSAIYELAKNDFGDVEDLYYMILFCNDKLVSNNLYHEYKYKFYYVSESVWTIFQEIQANIQMRQHSKNGNISWLEDQSIDLAILNNSYSCSNSLESDYYQLFDEEQISYHQYLLLQIIRHYFETENISLINVLEKLSKKNIFGDGEKEKHSNMMKFVLLIKISYYIFSNYFSSNPNSQKQKYIEKVLNTKSGYSKISFRKVILIMSSKTEHIALRKDTIYDYFFSNHMEASEKDFVRFVVCLSMMKGFELDFSSFIHQEVKLIYDMFTQDGQLNEENQAYYNHIASFYGFAQYNINNFSIYKKAKEEMLKYPIYKEKEFKKAEKRELEFSFQELLEEYTF